MGDVVGTQHHGLGEDHGPGEVERQRAEHGDVLVRGVDRLAYAVVAHVGGGAEGGQAEMQPLRGDWVECVEPGQCLIDLLGEAVQARLTLESEMPRQHRCARCPARTRPPVIAELPGIGNGLDEHGGVRTR